MAISYLFCINTGRSGSEFLYRVFNYLDNCESTHEPSPIMNGVPMMAYLKGDKQLLVSNMPDKLNSILKLKASKQLYVETNHCFIKGFGWEIPSHIPQEQIGVIILRRAKEKIASSYLSINTTPYNITGQDWLITPYQNSLVKLPRSYFIYQLHRFIIRVIWNLSKVQLCSFFYPSWIKKSSRQFLEWSVDETDALTEKYKKLYPKITYFDIQTEEMNDINKLNQMVKEFGINQKLDQEVNSILNKKENTKQKIKEQFKNITM